jgi:hypothetical protein
LADSVSNWTKIIKIEDTSIYFKEMPARTKRMPTKTEDRAGRRRSGVAPFGGQPGGGGRGGRPRHGGPRPHQTPPPREIKEANGNGNGDEKPIPPLEPGNIRIIPLGGVEEIGKNMTAVEFGDDIIIIDCGFQFREADTPGIDYILPNTKYLEDRKEKIRGMFITHGHLDHIGGIPYVIDRIGYPPVYTRRSPRS